MVRQGLDGMEIRVTSRRWRRFAGGLVCAGAFLGMAGVEDAAAATRQWDGSSSALWSDPTNWVGDVAPVNGDALVCPAASAVKTTTTNSADLAVNSSTFNGNGYTHARF